MIEVAGSTHRSFAFPADLPTVFAYYSDLDRVLTYLPHICVVQAFRYNQFRMLYSTTELGVYRIRIFCDLQARLDEKERTLSIIPLNGVPPAKTTKGVKSATTQGVFSSKSVFHPAGDETTVEYSLELRADLPTPGELRFMPTSVVNRIVHSITQRRIGEIAEGFIERSIDAFPFWLAEMKQKGFPA
jgi:hypothetical protein